MTTDDSGVEETDASVVMPDASVDDAGIVPDAGELDAGQLVADSGVDAGPVDAGPPPSVSSPAMPCGESAATVFSATAGPGPLGERLACHFERTVPVSEVNSSMPSGTAPSASSEVDLYLLAYRTTRRGGVLGAATARVYLPRTAKAGPLPVIAVGHGSVGVADSCAPTRENDGLFIMAMPWASRGYAVIAPDFAGLGNDGVQRYTDNHDTGQSMLDAVRALRAFVPAGAIDDRGILVGYSQGGGSVLAAQALERTYGSGGKLSAVVAVAPQYMTRINSFGFVNMLRNPNALTVAQGYTKPVVAALRTYSFFENELGAGRGAEAFPMMSASGTVTALESRCLIDLGAWLPINRQYVRDLMDDTLRTSFLSCVDGNGCSGPGQRLYDGLVTDLMPGDPGGAPVLYLQGSLDTVMPVGEEAACNVPYLRGNGVPLTYCTDGAAAHNDIFRRNVELIRTWGEATMLGETPPACSGTMPPACQ
jgi:dienelactone hydrolase